MPTRPEPRETPPRRTPPLSIPAAILGLAGVVLYAWWIGGCDATPKPPRPTPPSSPSAPQAVIKPVPPPLATALAEPPKTVTLNSPGHKGHSALSRDAVLASGTVSYRLHYQVCVDPSHAPKVVPGEGYLGMPVPHGCNWYAGGFFFLRLDGEEIGVTPLASLTATESGPRAGADFIWRAAAADVRVRFLTWAGESALGCEVTLEPHRPLKSVSLLLRCYPSYFTSFHKRVGARKVRTPAAMFAEKAAVTLDARAHWWACYYDEIFDVANGEGDGPCAAAFLPDDVEAMRLEVTGYPVTTELKYRPTTTRMRLAFWDFLKTTNADALASMPARAAAMRRRLAEEDFRPAPVREWTPVEAERLTAVLAKPEARKLLAARIPDLKACEADARALADASARSDITGEEKLLRWGNLPWELRLAELLDF